MADAVSSQVLHNGTRKYIINIKNLSDGTGESAVTKVDISTLTGPKGVAPSKVAVEKITGQCTGMAVKLYYDRTTPVNIAVVDGGEVELDYSYAGGMRDTGTGNTGDILLTTTGHTAGDSYDLTLYLRLVA